MHSRSIKAKKKFAEKSKKTFRTLIEDSLRSNICNPVLKTYRSFLRSFKNGVFGQCVNEYLTSIFWFQDFKRKNDVYPRFST